eukprot:6520571-Prymnesium_polylepis.1
MAAPPRARCLQPPSPKASANSRLSQANRLQAKASFYIKPHDLRVLLSNWYMLGLPAHRRIESATCRPHPPSVHYVHPFQPTLACLQFVRSANARLPLIGGATLPLARPPTVTHQQYKSTTVCACECVV